MAPYKCLVATVGDDHHLRDAGEACEQGEKMSTEDDHIHIGLEYGMVLLINARLEGLTEAKYSV